MPGVPVTTGEGTTGEGTAQSAPEPNNATIPAYGWDSGEASLTGDYLTPTVEAILRKAGARDVLDAGCGNGALCDHLHRAGFNIVGIDADVEGIPVARRVFPDVRFDVFDFKNPASGLALAGDGLVDAVVSTEVVEHLYAPHELARFAFEALRPGGSFIISTPYHGYFKNIALSLINAMDKHYTALWHGGHIKFWSRQTLSTLLTEAGFEVTGFTGTGRLPYLWKSMVLTARKPG